jgi:hypothetical protein
MADPSPEEKWLSIFGLRVTTTAPLQLVRVFFSTGFEVRRKFNARPLADILGTSNYSFLRVFTISFLQDQGRRSAEFVAERIAGAFWGGETTTVRQELLDLDGFFSCPIPPSTIDTNTPCGLSRVPHRSS